MPLTAAARYQRSVSLLLCLAAAMPRDQAAQQAASQTSPPFTFHVHQPFGTLPIESAGCCPYAGLAVPTLHGVSTAQGRSREVPRLAFLLGAQKGGSTSLFQLLTLHPHIAPWRPPGDTLAARNASAFEAIFFAKEPHFFDSLPGEVTGDTLEQYLSGWAHTLMPPPPQQQPAISQEPQVAREAAATATDEPPSTTTTRQPRLRRPDVWLDATPDYLDVPAAACRIRAAFPDAKLLVVLRDPVARALSHWRMEARRGEHVRSFSEEVQAELDTLHAWQCAFNGSSSVNRASSSSSGSGDSAELADWNSCFRCHFPSIGRNACARWRERYGGAAGGVCEFGHKHPGYLSRGLYAAQLGWWLSLFPAAQLHVVSMQELHNHRLRGRVLAGLYRFLGLDVVLPSKREVDGVLQSIRQHAAAASPQQQGDALAKYDDGASRQAMKTTQRSLYEWYRSHNAQLYRLLEMVGVSTFQRFPVQLVPRTRRNSTATSKIDGAA